MGLGSVSKSWYWKIPPGGTAASPTLRETPANGTGVGAGVGVGTGVGVGIGVGAGEDEGLPPPQPTSKNDASMKTMCR